MQTYSPRMRDLETIDSELRLVAALRGAARDRGGTLPIAVADALLDERRELGHAPVDGRGDPVSNSVQSIGVCG